MNEYVAIFNRVLAIFFTGGSIEIITSLLQSKTVTKEGIDFNYDQSLGLLDIRLHTHLIATLFKDKKMVALYLHPSYDMAFVNKLNSLTLAMTGEEEFHLLRRVFYHKSSRVNSSMSLLYSLQD